MHDTHFCSGDGLSGGKSYNIKGFTVACKDFVTFDHEFRFTES